jgi:hypothetical protein
VPAGHREDDSWRTSTSSARADAALSGPEPQPGWRTSVVASAASDSLRPTLAAGGSVSPRRRAGAGGAMLTKKGHACARYERLVGHKRDACARRHARGHAAGAPAAGVSTVCRAWLGARTCVRPRPSCPRTGTCAGSRATARTNVSRATSLWTLRTRRSRFNLAVSVRHKSSVAPRAAHARFFGSACSLSSYLSWFTPETGQKSLLIAPRLGPRMALRVYNLADTATYTTHAVRRPRDDHQQERGKSY